MPILKMTAPQKRILREIRHRRSSNPITRGELAAVLGMDDRSMREQIAVLAKYYELPIGRSACGYYWRRTAYDDLCTLGLLYKKAMSMLKECALIRRQMTHRGQRGLR